MLMKKEDAKEFGKVIKKVYEDNERVMGKFMDDKKYLEINTYDDLLTASLLVKNTHRWIMNCSDNSDNYEVTIPHETLKLEYESLLNTIRQKDDLEIIIKRFRLLREKSLEHINKDDPHEIDYWRQK